MYLAAWPYLFGVTPVAGTGTAPADFETLTRHHTVQCLVEKAALAVGDAVGHEC